MPCIFAVMEIPFAPLSPRLKGTARMINWTSSPSFARNYFPRLDHGNLWSCYWKECQKSCHTAEREMTAISDARMKDINSFRFHSSSSASPFQPSRYRRWKVALVIETLTEKLHATKRLDLRSLVFDQSIPGERDVRHVGRNAKVPFTLVQIHGGARPRRRHL